MGAQRAGPERGEVDDAGSLSAMPARSVLADEHTGAIRAVRIGNGTAGHAEKCNAFGRRPCRRRSPPTPRLRSRRRVGSRRRVERRIRSTPGSVRGRSAGGVTVRATRRSSRGHEMRRHKTAGRRGASRRWPRAHRVSARRGAPVRARCAAQWFRRRRAVPPWSSSRRCPVPRSVGRRIGRSAPWRRRPPIRAVRRRPPIPAGGRCQVRPSTRPHSRAVSTPTGRAVRARKAVRHLPIRRGMLTVPPAPGTRPMVSSGSRNVASS